MPRLQLKSNDLFLPSLGSIHAKQGTPNLVNSLRQKLPMLTISLSSPTSIAGSRGLAYPLVLSLTGYDDSNVPRLSVSYRLTLLQGLQNGFFGFDLRNKTCRIYDSGNEPFSGANLAFIGKCVAAALAKPEATANKFLTIASFTVTQNEVKRVIEEEVGSELAVTNVKTSDLEKIGAEKLANSDPTAFVEYLSQYVFADGAREAVTENDAVTVLGLEEESLRDTVKAAIAAVQ